MRQRMQLTGTNNSFGLNTLINNARHKRFDDKTSFFASSMCFAGLVVMARGLNPIPFRTRPLNPSAPMVLCLKTRESRSPPGLQSTSNNLSPQCPPSKKPRPDHIRRGFLSFRSCEKPGPNRRTPHSGNPSHQQQPTAKQGRVGAQRSAGGECAPAPTALSHPSQARQMPIPPPVGRQADNLDT